MSEVDQPGTRANREAGAPGGGAAIVRLAVVSTVLFGVAAVLAAVWPAAFAPVAVPIALVLFAMGCAAFAWAYVVAIGRSRHDVVSLTGMFFLGEGAAPPTVARTLRTVLAVQVVVALAAATARPYTALAFGVLAPTSAVGLMALWAARHGRFPPRDTRP